MTFFRLIAPSGLLVNAQAPWNRGPHGRGPPGVANRFVPWVTQAPPAAGSDAPTGCGPPGPLLTGEEVLARRAEGQVRIDPVAQVEQLQLLGEQPGGVHRPHDQPEPDAVGLADERGPVVGR